MILRFMPYFLIIPFLAWGSSSSSRPQGSFEPASSAQGETSSFDQAHESLTVTPLTENPDVEAQLKGDYPPLERKQVQKESLPLGAIQHAWDKAPSQAGVYPVTYHPHEVIRLRCREMMTTTLLFPTWERLETIRLGDPASFKVETPQPHLLILQPLEFIGVDTNLTVIGASGNVYTFYLRVEGYNSHQVSDLVVPLRVPQPKGILWKGSQESLSSQDLSKTQEYLEEAPFDPMAFTFAFDMAGDPEIAPERVYSDNIRTWFDYGASLPTKNLPVIYQVIDGIDTPLNVTRHGTKLVAQGAGSFTLLSGQKVVCVTSTKKSPPWGHP